MSLKPSMRGSVPSKNTRPNRLSKRCFPTVPAFESRGLRGKPLVQGASRPMFAWKPGAERIPIRPERGTARTVELDRARKKQPLRTLYPYVHEQSYPLNCNKAPIKGTCMDEVANLPCEAAVIRPKLCRNPCCLYDFVSSIFKPSPSSKA